MTGSRRKARERHRDLPSSVGADRARLLRQGPGSHNFNAIVFYETGYNPFTMQQAARRAWRIGQSKDCRVYYLHYRDTMQQRAMALMARKMAAMMALDGRLSVEGLAGMADDESAAMALARSISDAIDSADIQRNWVKVASNRKPASSPLISFGQALLEDEPIDGLDILAIEPHLIAQTILDTQDEGGRDHDVAGCPCPYV